MQRASKSPSQHSIGVLLSVMKSVCNGRSKLRRYASALRVGSCWPERAERWPVRSFIAPPLPPQQQLVVHTLITHCNYTLPPHPSANRVVDSSQTKESTISASTKPRNHVTSNQAAKNHLHLAAATITTSGSVVTTSSRIAAACARALPARAAHLSGWIHRLRPTALCACPCT